MNFQGVLHGLVMDYRPIVYCTASDQCRAVKLFDIKNGGTLPFFEPVIVPSHLSLGRKFSHRKSMLATGEDLVSSEAVKRFPWIFLFCIILLLSKLCVWSTLQYTFGVA